MKILLFHFKIFSKHGHLYIIVPKNIFAIHTEKKNIAGKMSFYRNIACKKLLVCRGPKHNSILRSEFSGATHFLNQKIQPLKFTRNFRAKLRKFDAEFHSIRHCDIDEAGDGFRL